MEDESFEGGQPTTTTSVQQAGGTSGHDASGHDWKQCYSAVAWLFQKNTANSKGLLLVRVQFYVMGCQEGNGSTCRGALISGPFDTVGKAERKDKGVGVCC